MNGNDQEWKKLSEVPDPVDAVHHEGDGAKDDADMRKQTRSEKIDPAVILTWQERKNLILGAILIVAGLLTVLMLSSLILFDDEEKEDGNAQLTINSVFVKLENDDTVNGTYTLDMVIFLTNTAGSEADNVRVEVAGIDHDSRLTYAINNDTVNDIPGERTREVHVLITIPKVTSYTLKVLVFEDDTIKIKGYNVITIEGIGPDDDFHVYYSQESTKSRVYDNDNELSEWTIFIGLVFFIVLFMEIYGSIRYMDWRVFLSGLRKFIDGAR